MKASSLILILFCFFLIGSDTPEVTRENSMDIGEVITTAITTIGLIIVAWIGFKVAKLNTKATDLNTKVDKYHTAVNGNMEKLLEVTKKSSKAEGKLEAEQETDAKEQQEGLK